MASKTRCPALQRGIAAYGAGDYDKAVELFTEALQHTPNKKLAILDSRAAASEAMGDVRSALKDAKMCIDIGPTAIQGYLRSAKLFQKIDQLPRAKEVLLLGLSRIHATSHPSSSRSVTSPPSSSTSVPISTHVAKHSRLQTQLTKVNTLIRSRTPIDPLSVLPSEIWGRVLQQGISVAGSDFPLLPASVSRKWREVTIGCSEGWRELRMGEKTGKKKVVEWVKRSKGRMNSIELDRVGGEGSFWGEWAYFKGQGGEQSRNGISVAQILLPTLSKVKSLSIRGLHFGIPMDFTRIVQPIWISACDHLRHLDVRSAELERGRSRPPWTMPSARIDLGILSDAAPGLESIKLVGICLSHKTPKPAIDDGAGSSRPQERQNQTDVTYERQLQQLRSLELSLCFLSYDIRKGFGEYFHSRDMLAKTLAAAVNLEKIKLDRNSRVSNVGAEWDSLPADSFEPEYLSRVFLPNVTDYQESPGQEMIFDSSTANPFRVFLNGGMAASYPAIIGLSLPNLRRLKVHYRPPTSQGYLVTAMEFLAPDILVLAVPNLAKLESIYWDGIAMGREILQDTYPRLRNIRHLDIVDLPMDVLLPLVTALPLLCPRLDSLTITRMTGSASPLLKLVKARRGGCASQGQYDAIQEGFPECELQGDVEVIIADDDEVIRPPNSHARGKRKEDFGEDEIELRAGKKKLKREGSSEAKEGESPPGASTMPGSGTAYPEPTGAAGKVHGATPQNAQVEDAKVPIEYAKSGRNDCVRIASISVHHCENFEKEAEQWLRQAVSNFSIVWPAREKERMRDKMV